MSIPPWREYKHGVPVDDASNRTPSATETDAKITKLYGPDGKVLRTYSNRPPIGFHSPSTSPQEPS